MYARLIIEVGALEYILQEMTPADMDELEVIQSRYDDVEAVEDHARIDLEFHQKLLSISRNPVLQEIGAFSPFFIKRLFLGVNTKGITSRAHTNYRGFAESGLSEGEAIMRALIVVDPGPRL